MTAPHAPQRKRRPRAPRLPDRPKPTLVELAGELGMSVEGLKGRCARLGITPRIQNGLNVITPLEATALRDAYRTYLNDQDATTWLTSHEAATALGLTMPQFYQRMRDGRLRIEHRHRRVTRGVAYAYNPRDVEREARRLGVHVRTGVTLAGHMRSVEFARALGVTKEALNKWGRAGCPRVLDSRGHCQWHPGRVLAWLEANPLQIEPDRSGPHAFVGHRKAIMRRLRDLTGQGGQP